MDLFCGNPKAVDILEVYSAGGPPKSDGRQGRCHRLRWVRVIVVHPHPVPALLTGVREPVIQHEVENFRFVRPHGALDHLRQRWECKMVAERCDQLRP